MLIAVFWLTVICAGAWVWLFAGSRRIPREPFVELAHLRPGDFDPAERMARLAVREAVVSGGGVWPAGAEAIEAGLERLAGSAESPGGMGSLGARIRERALELGAGEAPPLVAICVAARNEAVNLPECLLGLGTQAYGRLRVYVCDDQSDDGTWELLERVQSKGQIGGLEAFRSEGLPAGWSGKNHALHLAAGRALAGGSERPEYLLFVDADVRLSFDAVHAAVEIAEREDLDLLSVVPNQECGTLAEALMVPFLFHMLSLLFPSDRELSRPEGQYLACGQFILIRTVAYEQVGGHAALAGVRVEDIALATRVHKAGGRCLWGFTRILATTRMYRGWREVWRGLVKNAYEGMGSRPEKLVVGLLVAGYLAFWPWVSFALWNTWDLDEPGMGRDLVPVLVLGIAVISTVGLLASAASIARMQIICNARPVWLLAWTLPVSTLLYMVICIQSFVEHVFLGGPSWKGRRYGRRASVKGVMEKG